LLFFSPVGAWGQTVKIAPPLTTGEEALREGLAVLAEAIEEVLSESNKPQTSSRKTAKSELQKSSV